MRVNFNRSHEETIDYLNYLEGLKDALSINDMTVEDYVKRKIDERSSDGIAVILCTHPYDVPDGYNHYIAWDAGAGSKPKILQKLANYLTDDCFIMLKKTHSIEIPHIHVISKQDLERYWQPEE